MKNLKKKMADVFCWFRDRRNLSSEDEKMYSLGTACQSYFQRHQRIILSIHNSFFLTNKWHINSWLNNPEDFCERPFRNYDN